MKRLPEKKGPGGRLPVFEKPLEIVRPTFPPLDVAMSHFKDCLASGRVTNNSRWVVEFEKRLTDWLGVPTLVFSSGQAALMTMLKAAGVEGGEVVVPSFTFPATPHAVVWAGATPVFADIRDDMSFGIDPDDAERRISERTKAILGVCPYGIACDYAALEELGRRRGLPALVDSAAAFGARVGGRLAGGFCDAQIFSFHATKAFNTMEGGALCSSDPDILERARAVRNFGQSDGDCAFAGLNGKMTEICALIGIEQLAVFEAAIAVRRHAAARIAAGLGPIKGIEAPLDPPGQKPVWLYLPVIIDAELFGAGRDQVAEMLEAENLRVRKYYSPACHELAVYRGGAHLPVAERIARGVIALPIYNDMTDTECDGIVEAFHRVAAGVRADAP